MSVVTEALDQSFTSLPKGEISEEVDLEFEKLIKSLKEKPTTPNEFAAESIKVVTNDEKQSSNDVNGFDDRKMLNAKPTDDANYACDPTLSGFVLESQTKKNSRNAAILTHDIKNENGKVFDKINSHKNSKLQLEKTVDIPKSAQNGFFHSNSIMDNNKKQQFNVISKSSTSLNGKNMTLEEENFKTKILKPAGMKKLSSSSENVRHLVSKFEDTTDGLKKLAPNVENMPNKNSFDNLKACFEAKPTPSIDIPTISHQPSLETDSFGMDDEDDDDICTITFDDEDVIHLPLDNSDVVVGVDETKIADDEVHFGMSAPPDSEFEEMFEGEIRNGSPYVHVDDGLNEKSVANDESKSILNFDVENDLLEKSEENCNSFTDKDSEKSRDKADKEMPDGNFDHQGENEAEPLFLTPGHTSFDCDLKESDVDGLSDDEPYDSDDFAEPIERNSPMKVVIQLKKNDDADLRESDVDGAVEDVYDEEKHKYVSVSNNDVETEKYFKAGVIPDVEDEIVGNSDADLRFTVSIVNQGENNETDGDGQSSSSSR